MEKLLLGLTLFFWLLVLTGLSAQADTGTPPWSVYDGDTARQAGVTYRFKDYDTPEIKGRCQAERLLARKARERLAVLLGPPNHLSIGLQGKDKYGRQLATVTVNGVPLDAIMVSEGLAVPYICPANRCKARIDWCN